MKLQQKNIDHGAISHMPLNNSATQPIFQAPKAHISLAVFDLLGAFGLEFLLSP
jgi:hypothetical protein